MPSVTILTAPARPFTRADLDAMPDDGYRYELLDGMLLVSAAPVPRHQIVLANLHLVMHGACPADLLVLFAPVDVALAEDTVLEPDLLVAPRGQFTERDLPGAPLLAVEVLSPSTSRVDRLLKRDRYQQAGCPSYWLIDPAEPSVVVLELQNGEYVERGRATGDEVLQVDLPYPVTLVPGQLLA